MLQFGIRGGSVPAPIRDGDLWDTDFKKKFNVSGLGVFEKKMTLYCLVSFYSSLDVDVDVDQRMESLPRGHCLCSSS